MNKSLNRDLLQKHIQTIYDSVLEDAGWELLLAELVADLNFRSGAIGVETRDTGILTRSSYGYDDHEVQQIRDHYHKLDVWTQELWRQPGEEFYASEHLYPQKDLEKTEFYNDFCKQADIGHAIGSFIQSDNLHGLRISLQRTHNQGSCEEHIPFLNRLTPHLVQAVKLRQQLHDYEVQLQGVCAIIDGMPIAALLLDENVKVQYANVYAEKLFEKYDVLQYKNSYLYFKHRLQGVLTDLLVRAVRNASGDSAERQDNLNMDTLVLPVAGMDSDLEVQVRPIGAFESMFGMHIRKSMALVFIKEVNPRSPLNSKILIDLFNLSQREIELANLLARGESLSDIARQRRRSLNTLKTQLKSLFSKTGTKSQSQLVARLLSSLAAAKL